VSIASAAVVAEMSTKPAAWPIIWVIGCCLSLLAPVPTQGIAKSPGKLYNMYFIIL
jgi:hypothetical protein